VKPFPDEFMWGAATAAYQIEGGAKEDGRGPSVWDVFSHTPGRVFAGDTGDVACDHYHLWESDLDLMADLGVKAYRFSIGWSRVMPTGEGTVNEPGMAYYDRLVDGLVQRGIRPFVTLNHWDLPQALEEQGGWRSRATIGAFVAYATAAVERLGDRVGDWATHNEPWVISWLGHLTGIHAPGRRSLDEALAVGHHLLLSHGRAVRMLRETAPDLRLGIVVNVDHKVPASSHPADVEAARLEDGRMNRWYLDPLAGRGYPADVVADFGWQAAEVRPGDLAEIAAPLDFLGVNYYQRHVVCDDAVTDGERPKPPIVPGPWFTEMGWEVSPSGLGTWLDRLHSDYPFPTFYVTENGAAMPDHPDAAGNVDDQDRIEYLRLHFIEAREATQRGVPLDGYFVWSLLDNFEWAFGYSKRFGLVRVDYETQRRIPKASARWYSDVIASNGSRLG